MAAKKRLKKSTKPSATLRRVTNKKSLNGYGALEPIVSAYFSTVFRVVDDRGAWGNYSSHYARQDYATLDPNDILARASELHVERGLTKRIGGDTFLVAKGRSHSLLIKLSEYAGVDIGTIILDFHKTSNLTIGSLYSKIELIFDNNFIDSKIYVTRKLPAPISVSDTREWSLVTSNSGKRGWNLHEDAKFTTPLGTAPELLLHACINVPYLTWAFGLDDSQIAMEIGTKHDLKGLGTPKAQKLKMI